MVEPLNEEQDSSSTLTSHTALPYVPGRRLGDDPGERRRLAHGRQHDRDYSEMPPVDRDNPVRAASSESEYSVMEFFKDFPDDAACLEWLWRERHAVDDAGKRAFCPKCELDRPFHKVKDRPAWDCDYCGYHLHPTAGTIFHKSSTSLQLWFYAMFLMSQTRCGISAKQLERELGVTYKTAWRMLNKIRNQLMDQGQDEPLSGDVEVDETAGGEKHVRASDTRKGPQHVAVVKSYRPTIWEPWSVVAGSGR
jgi:transposase-like protein